MTGSLPCDIMTSQGKQPPLEIKKMDKFRLTFEFTRIFNTDWFTTADASEIKETDEEIRKYSCRDYDPRELRDTLREKDHTVTLCRNPEDLKFIFSDMPAQLDKVENYNFKKSF